MKRYIAFFLLLSLAAAGFAQTNLEEYFNLCLEFGAPQEIVELYQPFRTYKGENNGSVSYVVREDNALLRDKPYSEYQIWYTIDKELGLYQSSLIVRGDKPVLQNILTVYLSRFNALYGEPVYTNLDNGSLLIFWYSETTFTVKARLLLDVVNSYKFVSITFCSPQLKHTNLLRTLYNGTEEEAPISGPGMQGNLSPSKETPDPEETALEVTAPGEEPADNPEALPADDTLPSEPDAQEDTD